MKALVTGASGFIGHHLVRRLVEVFGNDAVVGMVGPSPTPLEAGVLEAYAAMGLALIHGDLMQDPSLLPAPPEVELVFHLAANTDTDGTDEALRVNHVGTTNLLDWLAPVLEGCRVVYASSVAVHDRIEEPNGPISEDSPFVPRTGYGETKLEGERIVSSRAQSLGYTWTIPRFPTVYGPGQKAEGLFDQLIQQASSGGILGRIDWPGRTSVIYVGDLADALVELSGNPEAANSAFCVASDDDLTVGSLAKRIRNVMGHPASSVTIPNPILAVTRPILWNRVIQAVLPSFARLAFWRLSLMLSDGFWFDSTHFRSRYRKPLRSLEEGLAEMDLASGGDTPGG